MVQMRLRRKSVLDVLTYVLLIILSTIFIFPIYWMFATAFKPRAVQLAIPPTWIFNPTLMEFLEIFVRTEFASGLLNTVIVTIVSVILITIIGSLAGYSFARFKWMGRDTVAILFLAIWMFPPITLIIPLFLIHKALLLLDTHLGLILVYTYGELALAIWLMRSFFLEVPVEIDEAAMLDGHSIWSTFFRIILPLVRSGVITTALLLFILIWNDFLVAHILSRSAARTAPVIIETFKGLFGARIGWIMAAGVLLDIPIFIFALIIQKHLVRGLTFGAIRG